MWVRTAAEVSPAPLQFTVPAEPSRLRISSFLHWTLTLSGFNACETRKRSGDRAREDAKATTFRRVSRPCFNVKKPDLLCRHAPRLQSLSSLRPGDFMGLPGVKF